jgi:two-component system sensor histidine kinase BaeS
MAASTTEVPGRDPEPAVAELVADPDDGGMDMMDDGPSVVMFAVLVVAVSVLAMAVFPVVFRRLSLRRAVPGLALIGPVLALAGGMIGSAAMVLSGRDVWYSLVVAVCAAGSAIVVGLRLANPVARDLATISTTVKAVAGGDRRVRTSIDRADEIGELSGAVDDLIASLARAEAEREAADEERNAVVGALSHDLRTPLASLVVSLDAVEDGIGDPRAHIRAMRGNVQALERLIEDLFLLARADAGSLALTFEPIDLTELLDEAVEVVRPLAIAGSIDIRVAVDEPILVAGDHTALGRVFRNLLDNAVRHAPDRSSVVVDHVIGDGAVRVRVADQGDGFPPDFAPRALERFSQADAARSRPGSAGLGLAIADALVSAHGGRVQVRPGPGGLVEVDLPVLATPARPVLADQSR